MAQLAFEIQGHRGKVAVVTFQQAMNLAFGVLREVDERFSGARGGTICWYIDDLFSGDQLGVIVHSGMKRFKRKEYPDYSAEIVRSFINGIDDIENRAIVPPYISEFGMRRVDHLASLIGKNGAQGFLMRIPDVQEVVITSKSHENLGVILPTRHTSVGSVEGKLEAMNLHGNPKVVVYSSRTKKAVSCIFDPKSHLESVKAALGQRVSVFGELQKNAKSETVRISMQSLRLLGVDVPLTRKLEMIADQEPDFADAVTTAEYIRRVRGGQAI